MHISREFLMEAFGLSLLVALILISVQIFQRTVRITDLMKEEQEQQIQRLEEYEIMQYDAMYLDGMTVIGYIKNVVLQFDIPISVTTEQRKYTVKNEELFPKFREIESEYYINPLALYFCRVIRDENESISEICITIETEEEER